MSSWPFVDVCTHCLKLQSMNKNPFQVLSPFEVNIWTLSIREEREKIDIFISDKVSFSVLDNLCLPFSKKKTFFPIYFEKTYNC